MSVVQESWENIDIYTAAQSIKSFGTGIFPSHWLEMSKSRLYDGNSSGLWTLHRIVRDLLAAFSPICPFFTHYLSTTLYDHSSVDIRGFPRLPDSCKSGQFENIWKLTDDLVRFNSKVWKAKKEMGVSLKSPIDGISIPNELEFFHETLKSMHNIGSK